MRFPAPAPQVPVQDLDEAISYYQSRLGFKFDWKHEEDLAGVSRGAARLFLRRTAERKSICLWLNLNSTAEVDELYEEWKNVGADICSRPEQKPWGLYEFTAKDCDENEFRVFYDTTTPASSTCEAN